MKLISTLLITFLSLQLSAQNTKEELADKLLDLRSQYSAQEEDYKNQMNQIAQNDLSSQLSCRDKKTSRFGFSISTDTCVKTARQKTQAAKLKLTENYAEHKAQIEKTAVDAINQYIEALENQVLDLALLRLNRVIENKTQYILSESRPSELLADRSVLVYVLPESEEIIKISFTGSNKINESFFPELAHDQILQMLSEIEDSMSQSKSKLSYENITIALEKLMNKESKIQYLGKLRITL